MEPHSSEHSSTMNPAPANLEQIPNIPTLGVKKMIKRRKQYRPVTDFANIQRETNEILKKFADDVVGVLKERNEIEKPRPNTLAAATMDSQQLKLFLEERGHLDLLRDFEAYCSYPASPDQPDPNFKPEMEVDNPIKESTKRSSESQLSEESISNSWSDNSNDVNDSEEEEEHTLVSRRKPRRSRLYAKGLAKQFGKKPKASTSAPPAVPPQRPPPPRRLSSKTYIIGLPGVPPGSQTLRTPQRPKIQSPKRQNHHSLLRQLTLGCQRPPRSQSTRPTSSSPPHRKNLNNRHPFPFTIRAAGLKIQAATVPDFRHLSTAVAYHTYSLKKEREFRVVLRRVPKEIPIEEVKEDLIAQDLPVQSVRRITNRAREPLVLVTANTGTDTATKRSFYRIKACLGDHGTAVCTRNKDTDGPPACVLYKSSGHTANYLGCPRAPKRKNLHNNKTSPPPAQAAPRRAPARAVTQNLSYAKATASPRKDPPTNSAPSTSSAENIKTLMSMISIIDKFH
ncbi:hypothetical protein EVAR_6875_1 [Eumeta japonica]|uniref:Pre-C2HC domain-containing protein n=1 Tax=Eumeta variegata TaxID=151549 RepID=A0A4C1TJP6_EUMVA|nr:hypothetical protein EVAR_6875_1 [Eumeta japonica]